MPVSRIDVVFKANCTEAIRYAYASGGGKIAGQAVASLAENQIGTPVSELYCASRDVENGFGVKISAYEVKVRLRSPAANANVIGVNVFDPQVALETNAPNFDGFPSGNDCSA